MSETHMKIEELLQRAKALEEKVDKTLKPQNTNLGKKSAKRNKLSLKKKRTVQYFQNKENRQVKVVPAKLKNTDLFSSIQFSSSEEEQGKDATNCDNPSDQLFESSLSASYSAVYLPPSNNHTVEFVPESCPIHDEQNSEEFSKNVSELVLNANRVMVRDSFNEGNSELDAGLDPNSSMSVKVVTSEMLLNNVANSKDECSLVSHGNGQHQDRCSDFNGVSTSHSLTSNMEHSVLVLSSRLEKILNSKAKKTRKSTNHRNKISDSTASKCNSRSNRKSDCSLGMKRNKRQIGKIAGNQIKLVKAICFSSEEDEVQESITTKSSEDVHLKNKITHNAESSLNLSGVSNASSASSHLKSAAEDILSLTDRLNRILTAPSANKKTCKTEGKKPPRRRPKIMKMPDLFSSVSDSSLEEPVNKGKTKMDADSKLKPQQPVMESSFNRNSQSFEPHEKVNMSLQVSLSSVSEQDNNFIEQVKSSNKDIINDSVYIAVDKSLQCSFTPECDSSIDDTQDGSSVESSVTSKSLQVSLSSENNSCFPDNEELTISVIRSIDTGVKEECQAHKQQVLHDISLQVSMLSPDTSAELPELGKETKTTISETSYNGKGDNSTTDDGEDSNSGGDVLYKTAIDHSTSDPLYRSTSEHEPALGPDCALFQSEIQDKEEELNHTAINIVDHCGNLHKLKSLSKKNHGIGFLSSNESEKENCHLILCDSESSSDANLPDYSQIYFGKRGRARRKYTSSRVSTSRRIGPDKKYDDDDDDDIVVSRSHCESADSSSEDQMELFFEKMKRPEKPSEKADLAEFIVADDELSSEEEDLLFYIKTNKVLSSENPKQCMLPSTSSSHRGQSTSSPDSSDLTDDNTSDNTDDKENTPSLRPVKPPSATCKPVLKRPILSHIGNIATPMRKQPEHQLAAEKVKKKSFLSSLSVDCNDCQRDLDAIKYVKNFKKHKEELTQRLFELYNKTVFSGKLPGDLPINWNTRMYKTAGYCTYKKNKYGIRTTKVELSVKVCDSAERVRDTLIHELCHAVVWLLHGKLDGHGPLWKHWAYKANLIHPELPVISRCHNYKIQTKYTYKCTKCGYQIGRHSKSLDTASKVCGYCMSPFELICNIKNGPQTPGPFAQFVKTSYGTVKKQGKFSHQEIMRKLAADFASKNKLDK